MGSPRDRTLTLDRSNLATARFRRRHASLVILCGAEIGRDFRLRRMRTLVGRGHAADVRVFDDRASREHAAIEHLWDEARKAGRFVLRDLGSTNGTLVNNRRADRVELADGDRIQVGDTVLKFVLLDDIERRYHEEVRRRITYDRLTGLLTRESLFLALEMELERCRRHAVPLAVLMMDLDHFKTINDTCGHPVGSRVLEEVGGLIRRSLRGDDVAGRYGGEEFVAYLSGQTALEARGAAERVRATIDGARIEHDGRVAAVTISIGIASFPAHAGDAQRLVARADRALYRAKEAGRNRVCVEPSD